MTDDQVRLIAHQLEGTCSDFGSIADRVMDAGLDKSYSEDDMTMHQCHLFDGLVSLCAECGWWSATDDGCYNDGSDFYCYECRPEEEYAGD